MERVLEIFFKNLEKEDRTLYAKLMSGAHSLTPVIDLQGQVQKSGSLHGASQHYGEDLSNPF